MKTRLYLVRELRNLGVDVRKISIIPDELALISDEVRIFSKSYDYVFTTGGVGPTHDDLTMESIAAAFNRPIERHPELESVLRQYYRELLKQICEWRIFPRAHDSSVEREVVSRDRR